MAKKTGKAYYMISAVAQKYNIHPQTLRLYEREGLLTPSRTEGNTRLYSEEDLEQLETILSLTRDLGVNLAGVEIILNMRRKMERMQSEVNEFMEYVKRELARGIDDWEQRLGTALVKSSPTDLVRATPPPPAAAEDAKGASEHKVMSEICRLSKSTSANIASVRRIETLAADSVTLHSYLRQIAKFPRLTSEQERELGRRIQQLADVDALGTLVESNLSFVVSYATRYRKLGVPFLDLIHEGNLGLLEGARRFDPERSETFITHAVWWVRQSIMHLLSDIAGPAVSAGAARARVGPVRVTVRSRIARGRRRRVAVDDRSTPGDRVKSARAPGAGESSWRTCCRISCCRRSKTISRATRWSSSWNPR